MAWVRSFKENGWNMAGKDITEKILEDFPDVFADIVNVLLFDGKQEIQEEMGPAYRAV